MNTSASKRDKDSSGGKPGVPVVLRAASRHERMNEESVVKLAAWLDERLQQLEQRFHHFTTPHGSQRPVGL